MATVLSRQVDGLVQSHIGTQHPGSWDLPHLLSGALRVTRNQTQSRLSVFQAKCQESSYGSPRGSPGGLHMPGPRFQRAGEDGPERAGAMAAFSAKR